MPIFLLSQDELTFPNPEMANEEGLLAVGGDLSPHRLLVAYQNGIFPWYNPGEPLLWWSLDPRYVLFPEELKVAKSMKPYFNQNKLAVQYDTNFDFVIRSCQKAKRSGQYAGSWITEEMIEAYSELHEMGYAHSVEVLKDGEIVGGLYGISLGKLFFGESMFTFVPNASKFGFISMVQALKKRGFWLIDCQQETKHLGSLGAKRIPRIDFLKTLARNRTEATLLGNWNEIL